MSKINLLFTYQKSLDNAIFLLSDAILNSDISFSMCFVLQNRANEIVKETKGLFF